MCQHTGILYGLIVWTLSVVKIKICITIRFSLLPQLLQCLYYPVTVISIFTFYMESDQVRGTVLAGALLMSLIGGSTDSPSDCCLLLDTRNVSSCLSADTLKARAAAMLLWKRTFRIRVLAASGSHSTAKEVCVRCLSQGWHTGLATNTQHRPSSPYRHCTQPTARPPLPWRGMQKVCGEKTSRDAFTGLLEACWHSEFDTSVLLRLPSALLWLNRTVYFLDWRRAFHAGSADVTLWQTTGQSGDDGRGFFFFFFFFPFTIHLKCSWEWPAAPVYI